MATNLKIAEKAFRFGCGRYVQESGALRNIGEEAVRLHGTRAFIIGSKTALALTRDAIAKSLTESGVAFTFVTYVGFCCKETCATLTESDDFLNADIVIGVGGGNVMDAAKYIAVTNGKPVINVPTSSATCASFTPLSVFYTTDGRTVGSVHHPVEVDCVIADMDTLSKQPVRLALSGIYDAIAKIYELKQRMLGFKPGEAEIGLDSSYFISRYLCDFLETNVDAFCRDLREGKNTKLVYDTVYMTIALTGIVSGCARGSNQTAIGHKVYETLRKLFPAEVYPFLHGEMVGIGLIAQIAYNGEGGEDDFRDKMVRLGMKTRISEVGVPATDENIGRIYDAILSSSAMAGTTEEEHLRLRAALQTIV